MSAAVVLRAPELMLTDVGRDDGILRRLLCDRAQQLMRMDDAVVVLCVVVELRAPLIDLREPRGVPVFLNVRQDLLKEGLCVGNDRIGRFDVLVDLRRVDVHVDDARAGGKMAGVGGNAVREARADADQQVAALNRPCGRNRTVHADHAEAERLGIRDAADGHHGVRRRNIRLALQLQQHVACVRGFNTAAVIDHRTLGGGNHIRYGLQLFVRNLVGLVDLNLALRDKLTLSGGNILRDVDQHRTRTSGSGNAERIAHGVRQLLHIAHNEIVLGDRHGDAGDIDLLEGVSADEARADVAGDGDHRDGVHISRCDAGDEVGRARAARCEAHADLAGGTGIAVRRMSRALFMCRQNVMNAVAVFIKCVVDIEDRTARVAENGVNALLYERVNQNLRTVLYHAKPPPFYVLHTVYTVVDKIKKPSSLP